MTFAAGKDHCMNIPLKRCLSPSKSGVKAEKKKLTMTAEKTHVDLVILKDKCIAIVTLFIQYRNYSLTAQIKHFICCRKVI